MVHLVTEKVECCDGLPFLANKPLSLVLSPTLQFVSQDKESSMSEWKKGKINTQKNPPKQTKTPKQTTKKPQTTRKPQPPLHQSGNNTSDAKTISHSPPAIQLTDAQPFSEHCYPEKTLPAPVSHRT